MGDGLHYASLGEHPVEGDPFATPVRLIDYLWARVAVTDARVMIFGGFKVSTSGTAFRGEV